MAAPREKVKRSPAYPYKARIKNSPEYAPLDRWLWRVGRIKLNPVLLSPFCPLHPPPSSLHLMPLKDSLKAREGRNPICAACGFLMLNANTLTAVSASSPALVRGEILVLFILLSRKTSRTLGFLYALNCDTYHGFTAWTHRMSVPLRKGNLNEKRYHWRVNAIQLTLLLNTKFKRKENRWW